MTLTMFCVVVGWFLGGFTSGVAGFGAMMVALPILTLGMPPAQAVLVSCIVGAPSCTHLAWLYHRDVVWADMRWLWLGCLPGCLAGAFVLKVVPMHYLQQYASFLNPNCLKPLMHWKYGTLEKRLLSWIYTP